MPMTRDEFIKGYVKRSGIGPEDVEITETGYRFKSDTITRESIALPCACGEEICKGWAMVRNDPESIEYHNDFHAPKGQ